jgi:hypothetical protein
LLFRPNGRHAIQRALIAAVVGPSTVSGGRPGQWCDQNLLSAR